MLIVACKKVEYNKLSSSFWNPKFALPVAQAKFKISDILNQSDSTSKYLDPSKRPLLQFKIKQSVTGFSIADAVKIPNFNTLPVQTIYSFDRLNSTDLNLINTLAKYNVGVRFRILDILKDKDPSIQLNQSIDLNFSNGSDLPKEFKLSNIKFSKGKIKVNVSQGLPHTTILKFTFNDITKNSKKLQDSLVYKPGQTSMVIDLAGYEANFSTGKLTFSIDDLILVPIAKDIVSTDKISLGVSMEEVDFESIQGYFGQLKVPDLKPDTIEIPKFSNSGNSDFNIAGKFGVTNPTIKLSVTNGFGIPVSLNLDNFKLLTNSNPLPTSLIYNKNQPYIFPYPLNVNDQPATGTLELSKNTVDSFEKLLSSDSKGIIIGGKIAVNSGSTPSTVNFIKKSSSVSLDAEITLPLTGYANYTFSSKKLIPLSLPSEGIDMLSSLKLNLSFKNTLPIDVDFKVLFYDEFDNVIKIGNDTLNIFKGKFLQSPELVYDANTESYILPESDVNKVPFKPFSIDIDKSYIPYLKNAKKINIFCSFDTFNKGNKSKAVTLYDYYGLEIKVFGIVEGKLGIPKNL